MSVESYAFRTAKKIIAGRGVTQQLSAELDKMGIRSVLVVTQESMIERNFAKEILNQLHASGIRVEVVTGVMQEPTVQHIEELSRTINAMECDALVGLGGGSVLDATKLLAVKKTNQLSVMDMLGTDLVPSPGIPTILIPTTAGTGAEVTPNAIVTVPKVQLKIGVVSQFLLPDLAVVDPLMTLSVPRAITASTGMDAFTHSLESYISNKANPISDMFALDSIRKISRSIVEAYHDGESVDAREDMILGSMYGGMALTSSGTAAVHALAYPLGGMFNIPHGVANAMLLPHVTRFNFDAMAHRLAEIGVAMGLAESSDIGGRESEVAELVVARIVELTKELNIPQNLREFGVTPSDVPTLAKAAMQVTRLLNNNPKEVSHQDAEFIYRELLPTE